MATYRRDVYCELEFLKKFRDSGSTFNLLTDENAAQMWLNIGKFVCKSRIMINAKEEVFEQCVQTFPTSLNISKKYVQGECICSDVHKFEYVENVNANPSQRVRTTYMIDKKDGICKSYATKYGIVALSPSCWADNEQAVKHSYLFRNCGKSINKGEPLKWADALRADYNLSNCNAMVIIDNYLLKSISSIEQILDAMLPRAVPGVTREDKFHLTFIAAKETNRDDNVTYNRIVEIVKKLRPSLNCCVDMFIETFTRSNTFHDRYILTNNVIIKSGGGFDLVDKYGKATKQTDISILHPGIQSINDACDAEYMNVINRIAAKVVNCTTKGQWEHYPQSEHCQNRLIVK